MYILKNGVVSWRGKRYIAQAATSRRDNKLRGSVAITLRWRDAIIKHLGHNKTRPAVYTRRGG